MDYARKIGKNSNRSRLDNTINFDSDRLHILAGVKNRTMSSSSIDPFDKNSKDKRLANWEKWLKIRQNQNTFLESTMKRPREELILNSNEKFQPLAEMRKAMEVVAKTREKDLARARKWKPEFWKTPISLRKNKSKSECGAESAHIFATLTTKDLKPEQVLIRSTLPLLIQKEKKLENLKKVKHSWKNSEYLKEKIRDAQPEIISSLFGTVAIEKTEFFNEDEYLFVEGKRCAKPRKILKMQREKLLTIEEDESDSQPKDPNEETPARLKIETTTAEKTSISHFPSLETHNLTFMNETSKNVNSRAVILKNTGTVTITFAWRERTNSPEIKKSFFFNKNEGLILPGRTIRIPVYYKNAYRDSDCSKVAVEFWGLKTVPKVAETEIVFRMWGISRGCNCGSKIAARINRFPMMSGKCSCHEGSSILKLLDDRVRNAIVQEVIQDVLNNVFKSSENIIDSSR